MKDDALHGFIECSDGRLYHKVIAEKALEAWEKKQAQRHRTRAATAARQRAQIERNASCDVQRDEERYVHQGTGTGTVTETGSSGERARGSRWDADTVPDEWLEWAVMNESLTIQDARRESDRFVDHWKAQSGQRGVRQDWFATWRNWIRRSKDDCRFKNDRKSRLSAADRVREANRHAIEPEGFVIEGEVVQSSEIGKGGGSNL